MIFATRIDMAPDGMEMMASKIEALPSTEPGTYRFKANLSMEGGWRFSLGAKVQGETGTIENELVLQAVDETRAACYRSLILATILAAGAGGYWAGHRDVALSTHLPLLIHPDIDPRLRHLRAGASYIIAPQMAPRIPRIPRQTAKGQGLPARPASEDVSLIRPP